MCNMPHPVNDDCVKLRVVGALSGETVLESVEASVDWTVRRLKLAIARREGSGALLGLLFDGTVLEDSMVLSSFLSTAIAECIHTLLLVKMPRPLEPVMRALDRRAHHVIVQAGGPCISSLHWQVHQRQLNSSEKMIMAPTFSLSFGEGELQVPFKLAIIAANDTSFRKSRGKGYVQLKRVGGLPAELADVELRVDLGQSQIAGAEDVCRHNFANACSARLPQRGEVDFVGAVDSETGFCRVSVELVIRRVVSAN